MQIEQHHHFMEELRDGKGNRICRSHHFRHRNLTQWKEICGKQFPTPSCIRDVRAFLGLANQLGLFIPDQAHMTSTIQPPLKKGTTWNWLSEHQTTFKKIKDILTSDMVILTFDPNLDTILLTDASRLHENRIHINTKKGQHATHPMCI